MMRVLVTGGYGYIGGRLVCALAGENGFSVVAGSRRPRKGLPGVGTAVIDWHDHAALAEVCRGQDAVIHLAAMNEPNGERDPEGALHSNGLGTLLLLRAAEAAGVRRFIYVSTSKVFGNNPAGVLDEGSVPRPISHYAITHRLAEDYVLAAHGKRRLEGAVLRLSNAFGAPAEADVDAWMLISNDLCRQAATTGRMTLKSSGLAWRNFIPMADVISALRHVLDLPAEKLADGLFHLGGRESWRIWDLAQRIANRATVLLGRSVELQRVDPAADERHSTLDWKINKLVTTGWKPASDPDHEIDATLKLCRETYGSAA